MSSTYSPDLRIELIGTGDQTGVWGSTTNTNLSYVLEPAIAGYISVAVSSANQALTYINGGSAVAADNESVHAAIALTTSTGANFAVYAPPVSKLYVVYNASSYTATIYNSTVIGNTTAAGTGVAIPAGKTMSVWSDGTNITQQTNHLTSPSMSGTPTAPTAAFGTNTTQLATTAFVQAALQAVYPVGSLYVSTSSTNPGTTFGFGTWVAFGEGRTLIGAGGGYTAGATGGSADAIVVSHSHTATSTFTGNALGTHSHGVSDPGHHHTYSRLGVSGACIAGGGTVCNSDVSTSSSTTGVSIQAASAGTPSGSVSTTVDSAGSSGTGANLPPYIVTYMWQRTA